MKECYEVPEKENCVGCCFDQNGCNHPENSNIIGCGERCTIFKFKKLKAGDRVKLNDYSWCMIVQDGKLFHGGWSSVKTEKLTVIETGLVLPTDTTCSFRERE